MYADLTAAVGTARTVDLRLERQRAGVQALLRCCTERTSRVLAWFRKGQLGPGFVND